MEKQMEMDKAQFAEQLKNLVELGKKKKNVLEYQEINDFFKGITLNNEQMDLIFEYLEANGVDVLRVTHGWIMKICIWKRMRWIWKI